MEGGGVRAVLGQQEAVIGSGGVVGPVEAQVAVGEDVRAGDLGGDGPRVEVRGEGEVFHGALRGGGTVSVEGRGAARLC